MKTYNTRDADDYYDNEVRAFKYIAARDEIDKSFIQYLGSYQQGGTYNILLEFADGGTLEDFFQYTAPPTSSEQILMFWERFFNVVKALSLIHEYEGPEGVKGPDVLVGYVKTLRSYQKCSLTYLDGIKT